MNPPEHKDMVKWHLIDKIKVLGWLIDDLTEIDWETTVEMLKDKLRRIGQFVDITTQKTSNKNQHVKSEEKESDLTKV